MIIDYEIARDCKNEKTYVTCVKCGRCGRVFGRHGFMITESTAELEEKETEEMIYEDEEKDWKESGCPYD